MLIEMIHVSDYHMLQHGWGEHSSLWTKEALDVQSNLTTARINTYMHDYSNMHTLPSDQ